MSPILNMKVNSNLNQPIGIINTTCQHIFDWDNKALYATL
jgi:hypothetical protein